MSCVAQRMIPMKRPLSCSQQPCRAAGEEICLWLVAAQGSGLNGFWRPWLMALKDRPLLSAFFDFENPF